MNRLNGFSKEKVHNETNIVTVLKLIHTSLKKNENRKTCHFQMMEIKVLIPKLDFVYAFSSDIREYIQVVKEKKKNNRGHLVQRLRCH